MSEEDRLKLENELLLTKSKAQMINLYLDLQQKIEQLEKENKRLNNIINEIEKILSSEMYKDIAVAKCLDKLKELKENK